jgi:hypothetical protein
MKRGFLVLYMLMFVFIMFISFAPNSVYACSCAMSPSVQEELQRKTAVFSGKVVKLSGSGKGFIRSSADPVAVTFEVDQVWKGEVKPKLIVNTAMSSASCGYEFQMNTDYLVYANSDGNGKQTTIICDRTKPIADSTEDLAVLGVGEKPVSQSYLLPETGGISRLSYFYLAVTFATCFIVSFVGIQLLSGIYLTRKYVPDIVKAYKTAKRGAMASTVQFEEKPLSKNGRRKLLVGFISFAAASVITVIVYSWLLLRHM